MISKAYGFNFYNFFKFSNSFFSFYNFFKFYNFSLNFFAFHNSCQLPSLHSALPTEESGRLTNAMKRQDLACQKCHFVIKKHPILTNINKEEVFFIFSCHLLCAHTKGITFANVKKKTQAW